MIKNEQPPQAKIKTTKLEKHGHIRLDDYYWLNERENPEVIEYLESENSYYRNQMKPCDKFRESLFQELKARIKEDDESVPYKYNGYWYITRFEKGKDYPIYSRKKGSLEAQEEILFDCNEMAKGHNYFRLTGINISPDNKYAAFGVDTVSRRNYDIQIKNLVTGEILPDKIEFTTGSSVWANDNRTLFYVKKDEQTLRADRIYRHELNSKEESDVLIYHEKDETFYSFVYKTKSRKYIVIGSTSTLSDEYRILHADDPRGEFQLFTKRERKLEYSIYHHEDKFYVLTNADDATNFKLMVTDEQHTARENWQELIAHRKDVLLEDIEVFEKYLVLNERFNGLDRIQIRPWSAEKESYYIPFDNETYTAFTSVNLDFDTEILRYGYSSMTTPASTIDFNMADRSQEIKKVSEVPDGKFNAADYQSERVWANARDGKKVAISMVYRKDMVKNGKNPMLLYAYGSYGHTVSPSFRHHYLSLIDRGFIFGIVHVRGGEYLGRPWYESGKLFEKKNTFTDFIDCSKFVISNKYTSADHLYAMGGSAGGLLMGAIVNMAPELYRGVVAAVPFVDVVTTMLDESIPLTTFEYDEWGNPNDKDYYEYMLSYSPYDQLKPQEYPNILVITGLHDSQVQYWEPAKWVAKLRALKTDNNKLFLRTNMDTGHGGASGRFAALKELAEEFCFILDLEGINE